MKYKSEIASLILLIMLAAFNLAAQAQFENPDFPEYPEPEYESQEYQDYYEYEDYSVDQTYDTGPDQGYIDNSEYYDDSYNEDEVYYPYEGQTDEQYYDYEADSAQPAVEAKIQKWQPSVEPGKPIDLSEKKVRIGRIPFISLKKMMAQSVPLLGFLKKEMKVPEVRIVSSSKNYADVIDALARGSIDFAWVSAVTYLKRRDNDNLMPVAKTRFGETTSYRGVFVARADGKVQGLEDVKGNSIGFVDPDSASGYIYPLYLLKRLGINPHKDSRVAFLGNHHRVLRAVYAKKIDAGICLEETLASIKNPKARKQLIVLAKTPEIPSDIIVCRQDCPANLRESFLNALLKVKPQLTPGSLSFLPAKNEDFDKVAAIISYLETNPGKSR
jgi:phosphonate transport system substrate-binding protein